jgi:hypothetical protein
MGSGQEGAVEGAGPEPGGDEGAPEPQSFDFERTTPIDVQQPRQSAPQTPTATFVPPPSPVTAAPPPPAAAPPAPAPATVAPVAAHEARPEWTPTPPSDATREGPRSEP